jgi:hypothetical protein
MKTNEELTGMLVMVHPDLKRDPAGRQGQPGIITYADTKSDDIYVSFGKNETGLYSSDALLVMRPSNFIHREAVKNVLQISTPDFKTLFQIARIMDSAGLKDQRAAMQLALTNETVRGHSMRTLQSELGIDHSREEKEQQTAIYASKR